MSVASLSVGRGQGGEGGRTRGARGHAGERLAAGRENWERERGSGDEERGRVWH